MTHELFGIPETTQGMALAVAVTWHLVQAALTLVGVVTVARMISERRQRANASAQRFVSACSCGFRASTTDPEARGIVKSMTSAHADANPTHGTPVNITPKGWPTP